MLCGIDYVRHLAEIDKSLIGNFIKNTYQLL